MTQLNENTASIIADRFRALGEPMRLLLLNCLREGEQSVSQLVEATGSGQANVSKHLQLLYRQGFVARRKEGTSTYYRIGDPAVFELCDLVCGKVRESLSEQQKVFRDAARRSAGGRVGGA